VKEISSLNVQQWHWSFFLEPRIVPKRESKPNQVPQWWKRDLVIQGKNAAAFLWWKARQSSRNVSSLYLCKTFFFCCLVLYREAKWHSGLLDRIFYYLIPTCCQMTWQM
jgi:hypothetical protein